MFYAAWWWSTRKILAVETISVCRFGMNVHQPSENRRCGVVLSARSIWLVCFAAKLKNLHTKQKRTRSMMVPRCISVDANTLHQSCSHRVGVCILFNVG